MGKGQSYSWERRFFRDEQTGARITQLTSFPTVHAKLYFHINAFTPDSNRLVFLAQRSAQRDAPLDAFRVNVDGTELVQLTESSEMGGAILSFDGEWFYYIAEGFLRRVSPSHFHEERMVPVPGITSVGSGTLSSDGCRYAADVQLDDGRRGIMHIELASGEMRILYAGSGRVTHAQFDPVHSKDVLFFGERAIMLVNCFDQRVRELGQLPTNGHFMWFGRTSQVLSNSDKEGIFVATEGEVKARRIAFGEHFWHGAASDDGRWIVSDTNWPDHGLQLIHVPSGRYAPLCYPQSSNGHAQWTHPHPSFSPNGRMVVFNSDRTGIPHVYLVQVDEALREMLAADHPG